MTLDKSSMEEDLIALRDEDPIDIELELSGDNELHQGTKTSLISAHDIVAAGLSNQYLFSVVIVNSEWTVIPTVDDIVIIGGTRYAVMRQAVDSVDLEVRLDLAAENAKGDSGPAYFGRV